MRVPITGNPSIDAVTVKAALAALRLREVGSVKAAALQRQLAAFSPHRWVRQQVRRLAKLRRAFKASTSHVCARHPAPVSKGAGGRDPGSCPAQNACNPK